MKRILIVDIGGSSVKYATFTADGKLETKRSFDVPATFNQMKDKIVEIFNEGNYVAISISSPGSIDTKTGQGYGLSAIDYIPCGGNLKQQLEAELNVPVAIENDANCAGLSEVHFANGLQSVAYIVLGSGVGGCVIVDGEVVTGSSFFGGEFGYMPYKDATLSVYAGMVGLSRRVTGQEEVVMPGVEIFAGYDDGDEKFVIGVEEYFTAIAHLTAVLKYTQNPEAIIFAGAVTNRPTFISEVKTHMQKITDSSIDSDLSDVNIMVGQFGSDANLYGAYANLVRNYTI